MSNSKRNQPEEGFAEDDVGQLVPAKKPKRKPTVKETFENILDRFANGVGKNQLGPETAELSAPFATAMIRVLCDHRPDSPFSLDVAAIICGYVNPFQFGYQIREMVLKESYQNIVGSGEPLTICLWALPQFYDYALKFPDRPSLNDEVVCLRGIHADATSRSGAEAARKQYMLTPEFYELAFGRKLDYDTLARAFGTRNLPLLKWVATTVLNDVDDHVLDLLFDQLHRFGTYRFQHHLQEWLTLLSSSTCTLTFRERIASALALTMYDHLEHTKEILMSDQHYLPLVNAVVKAGCAPKPLVDACQRILE